MIRKFFASRLSILAALAGCTIVPHASAATKAEYQAATVKGLRELVSFGRGKNAVKKILGAKKDEPVVVLGRGEIMLISQLLLSGRQTNDAEMLNLARDLMLAANKVANDGYDTPEQTSLEQIGFALRELGLALPLLKEMKLVTGTDAERADETLKRAADFLLKYMPEPGDGNIAQRYALGIATVCKLFPDDARVPQWRAWAAKPFLQVLHFPDQKGLPGSNRRVLEKQGARWKFVQDTAPFSPVHSVDISEDSSGYQSLTIVSWMGIAKLIGREAEIKTHEVEAFIDRMYQQVMPVGILPAYGDAEWNTPVSEWIGIFEWAGSTFRQPKFRAAADAIFRFQMERGLPVGDLSEAIQYVDESITPEFSPRTSVLLQRISGRGERVPDKVILRGSDAKGAVNQPYVMMQATESLGHSHAHGGSISAYCVDGSVILNTLGYDATPTQLHHSFMVRDPKGPFLGLFGDPKGTLLGKIMPDKRRLTSWMTSDEKELRSASVKEDSAIAYGKFACDYLTAWNKNRDFNGYAFQHTRELALDKATGLLCVLDTVEGKDDVEAAFGPVWHIQRVLAQNAQGFLCQSDYQAKIDGVIQSTKPRPVWIAMDGPADTKLNDVFWKFTSRHGHSELPQEHHLTAEWKGKAPAGKKLAFLTVFVPLPEGTTTPPTDLKLSTEAGRASVTRGAFSYTFPVEK